MIVDLIDSCFFFCTCSVKILRRNGAISTGATAVMRMYVRGLIFNFTLIFKTLGP